MKEENHGTLTFLGVITIIYGLGYAILGTLSLNETIIGIFRDTKTKK